MIQLLPYHEIEMLHGHPALYMNKLEKKLNTPDDSVISYFVKHHLKYADKTK